MTTGVANHPHDKTRPENKAVKAALAADDMVALEIALTPMQAGFCREYVVDFNGTAAAIRAGYSTRNAAQQSHTLLRHKGVRRFIEHLTASKEAQLVSVNPDYVLQGLTTMLSKETIKDSDKIRIFEFLGKHLGMLRDQVEISGKDGEAIRIQQEKVQQQAADFITQLQIIAKKNQKDKNV